MHGSDDAPSSKVRENQEGTYRLLPVRIAPIAEDRLPVRLSMLETLDLTHPRRAERNYERLIQALKGGLPTR